MKEPRERENHTGKPVDFGYREGVSMITMVNPISTALFKPIKGIKKYAITISCNALTGDDDDDDDDDDDGDNDNDDDDGDNENDDDDDDDD